ncbi:MAG TPA: phosphoenolpyruvate synthase, partial [Chitinophagaceae bacterium]|nr:phosphoenolpyruvate synthase [Chitinophagaceae bacterium]
MSNYLVHLKQADSSGISTAGGKAANLAELCKIADIRIPDGFCINTTAFVQVLNRLPKIHELLDQLALLQLTDRKDIARLSVAIRQTIEEATIPADLAAIIAAHVDPQKTYAIRSSATAEDLPSASFAGQQDSYLNIRGKAPVLEHISKCWASLFTERAILYRIQNGFDHRKVYVAVIVQEMVFPQAAGILFTADPRTGNRKHAIIDAGFGLGEALVSGIVSADQYTVEDSTIVRKTIAEKKQQMVVAPNGGTEIQALDSLQQRQQVLTSAQILELEKLGRRIEAHFGTPQDIEWCLADGLLYILQSRPITTLFPLPEEQDNELHIYISVGHNQVMTDAMKPLGLSFFLMTTRAPMKTAGGRLFIDVAWTLTTAEGRKRLIEGFGKTDHLIRDALEQAAESIPLMATDDKSPSVTSIAPAPSCPEDPDIVEELIRKNEASVASLKQEIRSKSGLDVFNYIQEDLEELKRISFDPQSTALIMASMNAALWLNEKIQDWLGEKNVADILAQSVPHNITAQMGLDLMDVADRIRPYPQIVDYLQQTKDEHFLEQLPCYEGGAEISNTILSFLDRYGIRGTGEIDISRPRWAEKPLTLIPALLSNISIFAPGESRRKFEQGLQEALQKETTVLQRLQQLPDGAQKAQEAQQMIGQLRRFSG